MVVILQTEQKKKLTKNHTLKENRVKNYIKKNEMKIGKEQRENGAKFTATDTT